MFVLRLGSRQSTLSAREMPPNKKLKVSDANTDVGKPSHSKASVKPGSATEDYGAEWREMCPSVCLRNAYALKHNVLSDITLVVGQESVVFHCHRLILAIGSPVFEAMFYGALAETGDTVTIPDVDPEGFKHLLSFLYSNELNFESDTIVFKTYFAADKYCVTELKRVCEVFLCNCQLTPSNVWMFFESSFFLNSQTMRSHCLTVLEKDTLAAVEDKTFLDVNLRTVEALLDMDKLSIGEPDLIKNVMRWTENQNKMVQQVDVNDVILRPLLRFMRFGTMSAEEFVSLRKNTTLMQVLNDQDALAILEHIINPKECVLPDWCCSKSQPRFKFLVEKDEEAASSRSPKRKRIAYKALMEARKKSQMNKVFIRTSVSSSSSTSFSETSVGFSSSSDSS